MATSVPVIDPPIEYPLDLITAPPSNTPLPTLPAWVPPTQANDPDSGDINDGANPLSERLLTLSPTRAIVPILFGEDVTGAILSMFFIEDGYLYLRLVWCVGECEEVVNVELEDGSVPTGTVFTHYVGASGDGIDPTLESVLGVGVYVDDMSLPYNGGTIRLCYTVVKTPVEELQGFPRFRAKIKGLLVRDPRDTTAYSATAALALGHMIENDLYGLGATIDDASLTVLANRNEAILDDGLGYTEPRSIIGLTLKSRRLVSQQIELLRGYARCRLVNRAGVYYFIPLMATTSSFTIGKGDIIKGSLSVAMADLRNVPNVIRVYYTDTSVDPWRDNFVEIETPEVTSGAEPRVEALYTMNGFQTKTAALRFAYDKINERLRRFSCTFATSEAIYEREEGETFDLTHDYLGVSSRKMILIAKRERGIGLIEAFAQQEDDDIYSDEIADNTLDSGILYPNDDPFSVPTVFGLALDIETPKFQTSIYFSRIRATWDQTTYSYNYIYRVVVKEGSTIIDTRMQSGEEVVFPILAEDIEYTVEVSIIGFGGTEGAVTWLSVTPEGKDFPPSDVPSFIGYHFDGQVFMEWGRAADNHSVWYYEIQYGPASFVWDDGDSKSVVERLDANQYTATVIPPGTWDFLIKAYDNAENPSTNATRLSSIEVTSSSGSFLLESGDLAYSSNTNMAKDNVNDTDQLADWVTDTLNSWNSTFTLAWNANYTNIFYTYDTGLATEWISASLDVGVIITATWQVVSFLEVIAGDPTITIQLSDDNSIWEDHDDVLSVIATARYIRIKVVGVAVDRYIIRAPFFSALINVVTIDESFRGTTNGSGEIVFDLAQNAISFESLIASINDLTTDADRILVAPVESVAPFTQIKVITLDAATPEPSVDVSARVRYV